MKSYRLLILIFALIFAGFTIGQDRPTINFEDLRISAEQDFQKIYDARDLTEAMDIPYAIYLQEGIFIDALGVENGQPVYAVYYNLSDPSRKGETAFFNNIQSDFELSNARMHYASGNVVNPNLGISEVDPDAAGRVVSFLMIPESINKRVMAFDATTGNLIDVDFIPPDDINLSTPIEPLLTPAFTILISDQIDDAVQMYDTSGTFLTTFYGNNTAVLDNIRGIDFTPGFASLVVTVGGGANANACAEIDPFGNYVGNFIDSASGGLISPFDILFRTSDCLVAGITSDAIHQYDLGGNPLGIFSPINSFPEQIAELSNGNIAVANFSGTEEGIVIYSSTGTLLNLFYSASYGGPRGVHELGNGNLLVTNGLGVHEIDGSTGAFIRTVVAGVSGRFISPFDPDAVPVELTSFTANVVGNSVELNWATSTETNNSGFEILRSAQSGNNWETLAFVPGFGTTTEPKSYSYTDETVASGTYAYKLKQIDYDGSFSYSDVVEVVISLPMKFALEQNYPNPFNPSTSIQFSLPVDANVTIGVYNLVGEKVAEVVSDVFSAGTHKVNFDASGLSSGIYFYRIDAAASNGNNFSSVKKMTLLR